MLGLPMYKKATCYEIVHYMRKEDRPLSILDILLNI